MTKEFVLTYLVAVIGVFVLTVVAERILIPILRSHKAGQKILDIGPRWHKSKEGTPVMGGMGFILASMIIMAGYFIWQAAKGRGAEHIPLSLTLAYAVANGGIGFVDDYCKLIKKQNEGLTRGQKLVLQLAVAAAYVAVMSYTGNMSTEMHIPFTNSSLSMGWAFYPVAVILLAGVVNGGNITDGIDGLCSSVTAVIGAFFTLLAFVWGDADLSMSGAVLLGATLGFLVYNFHPARIFMGDTGSLFLGAMVIATAFQIREGAVGLLVAAVYIVEMLSSFLQIFYFKVTHGKRLFRMAPLHHHLEKYGWGENQIVAVFSAAELLFCTLAWFAL